MERDKSAENLALYPKFKFVYALHDGPINGELTWSELKDCDIILAEEVGQTEEAKTRREGQIRLATRLSWLPSGSDARKIFMDRKNLAWGDYIVAKAIETKKEFHYIDIRGDSPIRAIGNDAKRLYSVSHDKFRRCEGGDALTTLGQSLDKYVEANSLRTKVVIWQIGELMRASKGWQGKKIGVAQGAAHAASFRAFKETFPELVVSQTDAVPADMRILLVDVLKARELDPSAKTDVLMRKRILLSGGLLAPYLYVIKPDEKQDDLNCLADKIVSGLTPAEIEDYWEYAENGNPEQTVTERFFRAGYFISIGYGLEKPTLNR